MTHTELPQTIDPLDFARKRQDIKGVWILKNLSKLSEHLLGDSLPVAFELSGGVDVEGFVYLKGLVKTEVTLMCQRCLEPMKVPLDLEFNLSPVAVGEESKLPLRYEALSLKTVLDENGHMPLARLIEEELILGLPLIPKHDWACRQVYKDSDDVIKAANPFAALKNLNQKD